jgi:anion-transporting  ArsA/GET3 family ATPase
MAAPQLLFVTGKGGVGKTTVAAALGRAYGARRRRVLLVEMAADASLARLCGEVGFATEPAPLSRYVSGVRIEQRALVESYFRRLLRLPFLSRRLFASPTFKAVTAAAPGVTEFLVLDHLAQWTASGRFGRRPAFDTVIVDGPATGHAVRLLRTPRQLEALVPRGPLASAVARLRALLDDDDRTAVALVTIPDDMAVAETLESRASLAGDLGMRVLPPVLNRVWPRRFGAADAAAIETLDDCGDDPLLAAARLEIGARRDAERHLSRLRRAFDATPVPLREICAAAVEGTHLEAMGRVLVRGLGE